MDAREGPITPAWADYLAGLPPELAVLHAAPLDDVLELPDGRRVAPAELVAVLWEQVAPPPGPSTSLPVRDDRYGAAVVAAAWRHTVHRQARAVLALLDAGLHAEAQANARVALEHAVELVRLAASADADGLESHLAALAHDQQGRQEAQLDYLDGLDAGNGGQHQALVAQARARAGPPPAKPDRGQPWSVRGKFLAVPSGEHLHSVYGRLSESTHAGLTSAAAYLGSMIKYGGPVPARPDPTAWAEVLAVLCWACWAADDALLRFVVGGEEAAARHAPLMARVGLATG